MFETIVQPTLIEMKAKSRQSPSAPRFYSQETYIFSLMGAAWTRLERGVSSLWCYFCVEGASIQWFPDFETIAITWLLKIKSPRH